MWERLRGLWRKLMGGGPVPGTAAPGERRQAPRFLSRAEVRCRPAGEAFAPPRPARVRDVSCGGINLLVDEPAVPGTLMLVEKDSESRPFSLLACVRHVGAPAADAWALGCSFIRELDEEELRGLL